MVIDVWYLPKEKDTVHLIECDECKYRYEIRESQLPCDYSCPKCREDKYYVASLIKEK